MKRIPNAGPPTPWRRDFFVVIFELIERLVLTSSLSHDSDRAIPGDQAIHHVGCDVALMMVFKSERSTRAIAMKIRSQLDVDLSEPLLHILCRREIDRNEPGVQTA